MKAINDYILVLILIVNSHDWLRVSVMLDRRVQQLHLLSRHAVRIVIIGLHLINGNPQHFAYWMVCLRHINHQNRS